MLMNSRTKRRKCAKIASQLLSTISTERLHSEVDILDLQTTSNIPVFENLSKVVTYEQTTDPDFTDSISDLITSSDTSDSETHDKVSVNVQLAKWSSSYQVPHTAVDSLLKILKPHLMELPLCSRTLLSTPRNITLENIGGGDYFYIGIEEHIKSRIIAGLKPNILPHFHDKGSLNFISVTIGCDGLPISKSSNQQVWPLMGIVNQSVWQEPFLISIFSGKSKPKSLEDYLSKFVIEAQKLENEGITVDGVKYDFFISFCAADTPARSFLKRIKPHNSYFACEKCEQEGDWVERRVTFPEVNCNLRTDESFLKQTQEEHHVGGSPLVSLSVGMVSQFVLDYMHLVCLGVMRKLLVTWIKGLLKVRLRSAHVDSISANLVRLAGFTPINFARKPRSLREVDRFKAAEFRSFLLYYGIVCLKNVLPNPLYNHFLLLQASIFILVYPNAHLSDINYAKQLLFNFVSQCKPLYGQEFLVYNVHSLLHLPDDALKFSSLDNFSAFGFENYMQSIKKMIKSKKHFVQQIVNRVCETDRTFSSIPVKSGFVLKSRKHKYMLKGTLLAINESDSCFLTHGQKVLKLTCLDDAENGIVECQYFQNVTGIPEYPLDSRKLSIYCCSDPSSKVKVLITELKQKCTLFPMYDVDNVFLCIPLTFEILH